MKNKEKNIEIKFSAPIFTNQELLKLDNVIEDNYSGIMKELSEHIYRDRELTMLQKIIKYQDKKIKELEGK